MDDGKNTDATPDMGPSPSVKSEFNNKFITSRLLNAVFILASGLLLIFKLKLTGIATIAYGIPLVICYLYLDFTLGKLQTWEFYQDQFTIKKMMRLKTREFKYEDVSTYQERRRFGTQSKRENIPNYDEMAVWLKDKQHLEFDGLDFINYEQMKSFFMERCDAHGIESAEYRE